MEAEFVAWFEAIVHGLQLCNFISCLNIVDIIARPLKFYCDNSATIFLSKNDKYSKGSKHMDKKYLSLKEEVLKERVSIEHIGTKTILVDPLNKGLQSKIFVGHVDRMSIVDKTMLA